MLPRLLDKTADTPRDRILWGVIFTLLVAQIIAFAMLCNYQVKKAEARDAALQVERTAVADCMQYTPRATASSCANRPVPQAVQAPDVANATPVSFALGR